MRTVYIVLPNRGLLTLGEGGRCSCVRTDQRPKDDTRMHTCTLHLQLRRNNSELEKKRARDVDYSGTGLRKRKVGLPKSQVLLGSALEIPECTCIFLLACYFVRRARSRGWKLRGKGKSWRWRFGLALALYDSGKWFGANASLEICLSLLFFCCFFCDGGETGEMMRLGFVAVTRSDLQTWTTCLQKERDSGKQQRKKTWSEHWRIRGFDLMEEQRKKKGLIVTGVFEVGANVLES
ncbi:unnamed protein product [Periconia digitata]|uniref:Uncharacterized protein n=1 Tax=Periconia digitata TaxID=1303443 RepID=A0A9W4UTX2_9PLEO|nr:unnamed protein product [Periconia digitata]